MTPTVPPCQDAQLVLGAPSLRTTCNRGMPTIKLVRARSGLNNNAGGSRGMRSMRLVGLLVVAAIAFGAMSASAFANSTQNPQ